MNENSTIILVDDDPLMLRTLSMILKSDSYRVIEASTGSECLQLIREEPPDLVMLDVVLPDINGIDVCRRLKSDPALGHMMVMLMSAKLTNSDDRAEGLEGMADDYISLPISKRELLMRVRTMLRLKQTEEALRERTKQLAERVNKLDCLYSISTLAEQPGMTPPELFQGIVDLIPAAWQYPEFVGARIKIGDQEFKTPEFKETGWMQSQEITVRGEPAGDIEVYCLEEKPHNKNESPCHTKRSKLLKAVAERTGKIIESLQAEKALQESEAKNHAILDALPDLMFRISRQGEIIDFRANDPEDLVLDPDQVIGSNLADSIPFDVHAQFMECMGLTLDSGQMQIFEYQLPVKRGRQDFEARLVVSGSEEVLGIVRNITEQRLAEKALQESEVRFKAVWEISSDAMALSDPDGIVLAANPAYTELYSYPLEEIIGHSFAIIFPEAQRAWAVEQYKATYANPELPPAFESEIQRANGETRFVESRIGFITSDGQRVAMLSTIRDITERKQAEWALRESEEKFRQLVENIEEVFWIRDLQMNRLIYLSPSFEKLWGRSIESEYENSGAFLRSVHPDDRAGVERTFRQSLEEPTSIEYRLIHPDKTTRWVWVQTFLICDESGRPSRQVGVAMDITERKQAEQKLGESEERYRTLFVRTGNPIFVIDMQGDYIDCNEAALRFTECSRDELLSRNVRDFVVPGKREVVAEHQSLWKKGGTIETEYYVKSRVKTLELTITPTTWQANPVVIGVGTDVTERKQAEEQLRTALAEKETLLRELYHRTKNNMYVISSMLTLQADYIRDEQARGFFHQMENRIQSMALVHQKLYQSGNLSSIDLREYIEELADLLLQSYRVHPNRISLRCDMESVTVLIDSAIPCGLIVNELISNALQHAFPGETKGEIRIGLQKRGNRITLWVSDNGIGMPPGFDVRRTETLGLRTVLALGEKQLKGEVKFSGAGGVTCQVGFEDTLYRARI